MGKSIIIAIETTDALKLHVTWNDSVDSLTHEKSPKKIAMNYVYLVTISIGSEIPWYILIHIEIEQWTYNV